MNRRTISFQHWLVLIPLGFVGLSVVGACEPMDLRPTGPAVERATGQPPSTQVGDVASQASEAGPTGFFPLEIGNHWFYRGLEKMSIVEDGVVMFDPLVIRTSEEHRLVGSQELFGREYIVKRQVLRDDFRPDLLFTYWIRYRQDRAGLYEADVELTEPPSVIEGGRAHTELDRGAIGQRGAMLWQRILGTLHTEKRGPYRLAWERLTQKSRVIEDVLGRRTWRVPAPPGPPGGVLPGEITRLRFPLHRGQEWTIRGDPFSGSVVEGVDVLDLPPGRMNGFRIRVTSEFFGPKDVVLFWYGRDGFLGLLAHIESEARDQNGNLIVTMVYDVSLFLESLDLVGERRF